MVVIPNHHVRSVPGQFGCGIAALLTVCHSPTLTSVDPNGIASNGLGNRRSPSFVGMSRLGLPCYSEVRQISIELVSALASGQFLLSAPR